MAGRARPHRLVAAAATPAPAGSAAASRRHGSLRLLVFDFSGASGGSGGKERGGCARLAGGATCSAGSCGERPDRGAACQPCAGAMGLGAARRRARPRQGPPAAASSSGACVGGHAGTEETPK